MTVLSSPEFHMFILAAAHVAILLALLASYLHVMFWRSAAGRLAQVDAEMQRQRDEWAAGVTEIGRIAERLRQLEERSVADLHRPAALPLARPQGSGYEMAIRMAAAGALETELVASCGLSREEASLVLRLHGARARDAA